MQMFTGLQYLKIDIAGSFGLDKINWLDRIAWVDDHEQELEELLTQADEPALYHAGVQAYRDTQKGLPSGYPISLDATASGMQILACLTGCQATASLCNVIDTGRREDAYTNIYRAMCEKIGEAATIQREDTKRAIMTSLYSSKAIPKKVFGEGELLKIFEDTMGERAPGAWKLNTVLQELWQPYALSHDWVMPDNFHAHVPVEDEHNEVVHLFNQPIKIHLNVNRGTEKGRSLSPNLVHSIDGMVVREMHRRCDYDRDTLIRLIEAIGAKSNGRSTTRERDRVVLRVWELYEMSGFLSARILDYLDDRNLGLVDIPTIKALIQSLPEQPFKVLSVHDCFRVLPNHGNALRIQYNTILSQIAGSEMLSFLASQITGRFTPVTKASDMAAKVLQAEYALS